MKAELGHEPSVFAVANLVRLVCTRFDMCCPAHCPATHTLPECSSPSLLQRTTM